MPGQAARAAPAGQPHTMDEEAVVPDTGRVIIHFDVDAMYAQAEEVRWPRDGKMQAGPPSRN